MQTEIASNGVQGSVPGRTPGTATAVSANGPGERVLRQLVEALLYEGVVPFVTSPRGSGQREIYDQVATFTVGGRRYTCLVRIASFGRVRVAPGSVRDVSAGRDHRVMWSELIAALAMDESNRRVLLDELEQTVALCSFNERHLAQLGSRRALALDQLESAIVEGHLYHPCFKTRTGFTLQDHQDYGPEAGACFQLEWLAARQSSLKSELPCAPATFWKLELGPDAYARLAAILQQHGGSFAEYGLVPVHPWQLKWLQRETFARAFEEREWIALGVAGDRYQATQSLRTLLNRSHPKKSHVKLPLGVTCTSVPRNLRTHFVRTAPALSEWLQTLVEQDPFLQERGRLVVLREYAGMVYAPADPGLSDLVDGQLGAIYRESIAAQLRPEESAVPFTALMLVEADGRPFIADWLHEYGTERWVERLIEVMFIPLWHLLVHHGVALEAHAQNLILVHRAGFPARLALRDFHEDTEYVTDFLGRPELLPDFSVVDSYFSTVPDGDGYRMSSIDDLRELFLDTVCVFNLAELSFLLERFMGFTEVSFWHLVREQLRVYAMSGITAPARIARLSCDQPEILVESLLQKKLRGGKVLDFFAHSVANTLSY